MMSTNRLAPYNPTHQTAIDVAINLLRLQSTDVLFDLGCGDGRMLLRAADMVPGLQCVGIEIDESLVTKGRCRIPESFADRLEIRKGDVLGEMMNMMPPNEAVTVDDDKNAGQSLTLLNDATVIFVYLLPEGLRRIRILLKEAAARRRRARKNRNSGSTLRVASYMFSIPDWTPVTIDRSAKGSCPIYLYEL